MNSLACPSILFLINGLGLGNSARCEAIILELETKGCQVNLACAGRAFEYFSSRRLKSQILRLRQSSYLGKQEYFSVFWLVFSFFNFLWNGVVNFFLIRQCLRKGNPDLIVIDSVYNAAAFLAMGCPVISINSSSRIIELAKSSQLPAETRSQYFVEYFDSCFQKIFPDLVLCPWFHGAETHRPREKLIEPIVRSQFVRREFTSPVRKIERMAVIYSGSGLAPDLHQKLQEVCSELRVFGSQVSKELHPGVSTASNFDISDEMKKVDVVVIMGGLSSISESMALRVPMVIVPLPGHAEQWANAKRAENLGVAVVTKAELLPESLLRLQEKIELIQTNLRDLPFQFRGASQGAAEIINFFNLVKGS